MCYYITALLSPNADTSAIQQFAESHLLNWSLIEEHSLTAELREGETYYLTTKGNCDCDTNLGLLRDGGRSDPDYKRKEEKLRKKGWSNHKIERWKKDKSRDLEKAKSRNTHYLSSPPTDVVHWVGFISDILRAKAASYVGMLLHWYDGSIETEPININRRRFPYEKLDHKYLLRLEEDVIHMFSNYDKK